MTQDLFKLMIEYRSMIFNELEKFGVMADDTLVQEIYSHQDVKFSEYMSSYINIEPGEVVQHERLAIANTINNLKFKLIEDNLLNQEMYHPRFIDTINGGTLVPSMRIMFVVGNSGIQHTDILFIRESTKPSTRVQVIQHQTNYGGALHDVIDNYRSRNIRLDDKILVTLDYTSYLDDEITERIKIYFNQLSRLTYQPIDSYTRMLNGKHLLNLADVFRKSQRLLM